MPANLDNSAVATGLTFSRKVSFHSNPKEGQRKERSNYWTIALFSHASKFSSVPQLCPTLCDRIDCSIPVLPVQNALLELSITNSRSALKLMSIELVMQSNHFLLCWPLLLLPSMFPSISVFSKRQFFAWGGQSIRAWASASVLPMNI